MAEIAKEYREDRTKSGLSCGVTGCSGHKQKYYIYKLVSDFTEGTAQKDDAVKKIDEILNDKLVTLKEKCGKESLVIDDDISLDKTIDEIVKSLETLKSNLNSSITKIETQISNMNTQIGKDNIEIENKVKYTGSKCTPPVADTTQTN